MSHFRWRTGVRGLVATGRSTVDAAAEPPQSLKVVSRLHGAAGMFEVVDVDGSAVRFLNADTARTWQSLGLGAGIHGVEAIAQGILDLVVALKEGGEPMLSARKALQATELIIATCESSRKRGRIDLPLTMADSPFLSMIDAGDLTVG